MIRSRGGRVASALIAAGLLTLSGCKSSGSSSLDYFGPAIAHFKGLPRAFTAHRQLSVGNPGVAWAPRNRIYVVTMGSSSCPDLVISVRATDLHHIVVRTGTVYPKGQSEEHACTADLGPTTSLVAVPESVDRHSAVTVSIDKSVSVLPARR